MAREFKKRKKLFSDAEREFLEIPFLIEIQKNSFEWFVSEGLNEEFRNISPIEGYGGRFVLEFLEGHHLGEPEYSYEECLRREITYSAPLKVPVRLLDRATGEVKEQVVFMGDLPIMTERGTFLINGAERVIVSQFVRSPGVYFKRNPAKTAKPLFEATIIPSRGAWLEFETDLNDIIYVRVNKLRKIPVIIFLTAIGASEAEIISNFPQKEIVKRNLEKSSAKTPQEALREIYKKLRPGEPGTDDAAKTMFHNLFFDNRRYDLGRVGRYKMNQRLGLDVSEEIWILTKDDIFAAVKYLIKLISGEGYTDDIDHLGNRRVRSVGELLQKQFRVGLGRLERLVKEQMTIRASISEKLMPQHLINIRPLTAVVREFFGTSQLSQFMDQTNPLAELAHKRRLSALGPGGLSRERAGFEVRDIHPSHYGRICPIETPEGPNAGLIGPLAVYARVNRYGFIETPYVKVENGRLTDEIVYLTADAEDPCRIAPCDVKVDKNGRIIEEQVPVRFQREFLFALPEEVDFMGVSPRQLVGITTAMIPFLEHDDANRALMGSNMQRQATPLLLAEAPAVGTGLDFKVAKDAMAMVTAKNAGKVVKVDANEIVIEPDDDKKKVIKDVYKLVKYQRSNQNTCINQKPVVKLGQYVKEGQVIADGSCTENGEIALGRNVLVAFMPWEGYNFEDAILISEKVVKDGYFASIHISKHELEVRVTKLGPEEITREIPNVGEEGLKNLDDDGAVCIGAFVKPGDILVGKVTPKGETEPPAEEKLLRAIFGDLAREMRDTSLRMPSGEYGKIVDVRLFSRDKGDELPPGVNQIVRVYVAQLRNVAIGDKIAGRHGNKGVVATILPEEDMPFLPDGTPVDIILNPLGVPSRMNVGQTFETMLGLAAHILGEHYEVPIFDENIEEEASRRIVEKMLGQAAEKKDFDWVNKSGKIILRDGRTGQAFDRPVVVGYIYLLKLIHLVEDKIHARSTGPYSLVTQQPLGGRAQFGGQRFGEMEVWALEAYGAAHTLQELLTVKSDDILGRAKAYESIIKGKLMAKPGTPESFRVLLRELRSLCLNVRVITTDGVEIESR